MAALTWPTAAQCSDFVEHLCWAHSWYKHLPFGGASFVVFIDGGAGAGYEHHERMHYGWKTTEEYRRRYGLLDYAWRLPDEVRWGRDAGDEVEPSAELLSVAGFSLGPTCSTDFNSIEVVCWRYAHERPDDEGLRQLYELDRCSNDLYAALEAHDRDAAVNGVDDVPASPSLLAQRAAEARANAHYEALHEPQVAIIRQAIQQGRIVTVSWADDELDPEGIFATPLACPAESLRATSQRGSLLKKWRQ